MCARNSIFAFVCISEGGGRKQERQSSACHSKHTMSICVNSFSRLWFTCAKPKGGEQTKASCSTDALSLLSHNARSCQSKIMHVFMSLPDVTYFRQTLVLIFIVWLNWLDTE